MKKFFWMTAAVASLSLTACQERRAGVEMEQPAAPGQLATVEGVVTSLESDEIQINTVDGGSMEFSLDENVGIFRDGVAVERGALNEGDQVRASYSAVGEDKNLVRLEVGPGAMNQRE